MNSPSGLNARILIVDDLEANTILLRSILEDNGYSNIKIIMDSRQVVAQVDEFQPDLILLDLMMPHLDGYAVMEQLQTFLPSDAYLPILVLTADTTPQTKQRALSKGAKDFIAKPFDQVEVLLRIQNLLTTRALHLQQQKQKHILEELVSERTVELRGTLAKLKQSEATIQTLFRISTKLNSTLDVDDLLEDLAQEAIRIVNGESGFAGLRVHDGMNVRKYFLRGAAIPYEYTWKAGEGIPGWVLQNRIGYGTSDAANDPIMLHELAINADVRSIICTPILDSAGEVIGYFDIRNKMDGEGFTISDQEMLQALAPAASIAIQNALAYQSRLDNVLELKESALQLEALAASLELAREEERTQIARDLHDQLGQALTAMKFDLAWLANRLVEKDAVLGLRAKFVTEQMDTMIKTVRRISTELRPGMLDDLGLAASLEWQARDFEKRTGVVCSVNVPAEDPPLTRTESLALFRIFQEALTNITRHASASSIKITLRAVPEMATLEIHDNGRGIQAQEIAGKHSLGLLGMRERAKRLGGTFDIQGISGDGTIVTVTLPIHSVNDTIQLGEDNA